MMKGSKNLYKWGVSSTSEINPHPPPPFLPILSKVMGSLALGRELVSCPDTAAVVIWENLLGVSRCSFKAEN